MKKFYLYILPIAIAVIFFYLTINFDSRHHYIFLSGLFLTVVSLIVVSSIFKNKALTVIGYILLILDILFSLIVYWSSTLYW
jgi:hypothetical protein